MSQLGYLPNDLTAIRTSSTKFPTSTRTPTMDRRAWISGTITSTVGTAAMVFNTPQSCQALEPRQAASDYDAYAAKYDQLDGGQASSALGIDEARKKLLSQASGNVLEIGAGTGLNLDKYDPQRLESLTLVDISNGMLKEARTRIENGQLLRNVEVKFMQADATSELVSLFGDNHFDTVVDSFSLCVMGNEGAKRCLVQMRQVVKSGTGRILLLENSRSSNPLLGLYQDVTADAAASVGGKGCVYNQNVRGMIEATPQLQVDREETYAAGLFRSFQISKVA